MGVACVHRLVATVPRFDLFEIILSMATEMYLERSEAPSVLHDLYGTLAASPFPLLRAYPTRLSGTAGSAAALSEGAQLMLWGTRVGQSAVHTPWLNTARHRPKRERS